MNVLFVTWDGPDQSYLESLFLPLWGRLLSQGIRFHVLQFAWDGDAAQRARTAAAAAGRGIPYERVSVLRRPKALATAASVALGAVQIRRAIRRHDIDVLMPRSVLPALMALIARRASRLRLVYDADGFMPDERVDFAGWSSHGVMYRALREGDAQMLRAADAVVTRTAKAKAILLARAGAGTSSDKIHVIPNAKDADEFQPFDDARRQRVRRELGISGDAPLVVYAGSVGPQYFPERMFAFFAAVQRRRRDAQFLFLTGQEPAAREALERSRVAAAGIQIRRVLPAAVPELIAAADLGLALRQPAFSQLAVSPIKVAEYLLCGVPVLSTAGIGDLDEQLASSGVGRLINDSGVGRAIRESSDAELESAAEWLARDVVVQRRELRERCRVRGVALFGLDQAVPRYLRALGAGV
jgi:glycosyltransferase involved in cell wall biosynthesis